MKNELLLLNKKHTDSAIEQTDTRLQKTLDFKMSNQMETFSFSLPISLYEEEKCWL